MNVGRFGRESVFCDRFMLACELNRPKAIAFGSKYADHEPEQTRTFRTSRVIYDCCREETKKIENF